MAATDSGASILPEDAYEVQTENTNSSTVAADVDKKRTIEAVEEETEQNGSNKKKKERGQNKGRKFNNSHDQVRLCPQRAIGRGCDKPEGECKLEHNLSKYIGTKPEDIAAACPVYQATGHCDAGFRCRWLSGHVTKPVSDDPETWELLSKSETLRVHGKEIQNDIRPEIKIQLRKKQYATPKSTVYLDYLDKLLDSGNQDENADTPDVPLRPVEKRKLNWSGAKVLAPLTTTGNLPFRQICRQFGADVTYSEMAVSAPLLQGNPNEWALTRSHITERDTRDGRQGMYGVQLAGPKPAVNLKAAEVLSEEFGTTLDFIDLNCGCRK